MQRLWNIAQTYVKYAMVVYYFTKKYAFELSSD